ncbi:hypothetical protein PZB74_11620 [Porifericola rhodea]|uniref:hypothetical protein n=1 Tax=Porifericola rhodea TaxID=930972 RepID=UPI0026665B8A|nr:hypothetical protein [Porifericola rhodea]WKN29613.1 hypothetical protein PZB74_11620 [Porifericola rhodea]
MSVKAFAPSQWVQLKESSAFSVSFRRLRCKDEQNGVSFSFYAIRLENKSNQKINLQWYNAGEGEGQSDENYVSLILQPGEVKEGLCDAYAANPLMVLAQSQSTQPVLSDFKFYLL